MPSQISTLRSLPAETWAALAAALTAIGVAVKKFWPRKRSAQPDYLTRAEFHHGLIATRDRIAGGYLALADKIEANQKELLDHLDRHAQTVERRLDTLDSAVARLDERTKGGTSKR